MAISTVTEATFEREVLASELPVLVELFSERSPLSKTLAPRVADVATEFDGKLKVVRVDVDRSPRVAQMFRVESVPMLVLLVAGRPVDARQGAVAKHEIVDMVSPHLAGATEEVPAAELVKLLKAKQVVVLDVREARVFARAHIPGAMNVLAVDVPSKLREIAVHRKPVIVYDRSAGDEAKATVKTLEENGLPAVLLKGGFLGWEGDGLDIERS